MNKLYIFTSLVLFSFFSKAQQWKWAVRAGGNNYDYAWDVATDSKKNAYMVGSFQGTCTIGSTSINTSGKEWAFVAKYDSTGAFKWVRTIANINYNSYAYGIEIDKDDRVYVTGQFQGSVTLATGITLTSISNSTDIFLVRYDVLGNPVWATNAGTANSLDTPNEIATDAQGYLYMGGSLYTNTTTPYAATFGATPYTFNGTNMFIAKCDSLGNFLWVKGSSNSVSNGVTGNSISVTKNSVYITGSMYGSATFGNTLAGNPTRFNIYAAKYDLNGNFNWVRTYRGGTTTGIDSYDISADTLNNVFLAGKHKGTILFAPGDSLTSISNTFDALLMGLDSAGNTKWRSLTGSTADDQCRAVVVDNRGSAFFGGWLTGTQNFFGTNITTLGSTTDIFVSKISESGNLKWIKTGGGNGTDYLLALTKDKNKNTVHVGGYFNSTSATYGSTTISPVLNHDAMMIQMADTTFDATKATSNVVCKNNCLGSAAVFVNGTAPYQYLWNTGQTGALEDSLCVGNYTVTVTDANNRTKTLAFSINATDSLISNVSSQLYCNKDSIMISVSTQYGLAPYSYQYNSLVAGPAIFVNPSSSTVYTVVTIDVNNCVATSSITINNYTPFTPVITQSGSTLSIASTTNALQWHQNTLPLSGETNDSLIVTQSDLYYLVSTDAQGCSDTSNVINVVFTGIQNTMTNNGIQIFPNPAHNEIELICSKDRSISVLKIVDVYGKCVIEKSIDTEVTAPIKIDISSLSSGLYFILIDGKAEKFIKK